MVIKQIRRVLDPLLAPLRRRSASPTQKLGVPGTAIFSGFIQPIEEDARLIGRERYRTYGEILLNTSIVAASVRYYLNMVSRAGWIAEPAEAGGARAQEIAELTEEILHDMETPLHRIVRRSAMFRMYGFSAQEWTAKRRDDGVVGMLDIEARPQVTIERWDVDEHGLVLGLIQRSPQTVEEIYLPRSKLVYLVDDTLKDSPEGVGLLRHVVEPASEIERFEQLEGYGYETDLRGVPLARMPLAEMERAVERGELSEAQKNQLITDVETFLKNHIKSPTLGVRLDSLPYQSEDAARTPSSVKQWDMELMKAGNTSQENVSKAIMRKNREAARILGTESLLVGETGAGSLAMARDKSQTTALLIDSALKEIAEAYNKDIVGPLMQLNGWPEELRPKLRTEAIQLREVGELTDALKDMAAAGAILNPGDPAVDAVRELLGLPKEAVLEMMEDAALGARRQEPDEPDEPDESDMEDMAEEREEE